MYIVCSLLIWMYIFVSRRHNVFVMTSRGGMLRCVEPCDDWVTTTYNTTQKPSSHTWSWQKHWNSLFNSYVICTDMSIGRRIWIDLAQIYLFASNCPPIIYNSLELFEPDIFSSMRNNYLLNNLATPFWMADELYNENIQFIIMLR